MKKHPIGFMGLAASAALLLSAGASFADGGAYRRAAYAAPFTWTGCYLGLNAGAIKGHSSFNLNPSGAYRNAAGALAPPNPGGTGALPGDLALVTHNYADTELAWQYGGQVGCNLQAGAFVFGIEADLQKTGAEQSVFTGYGAIVSANPAFTIAPHTESVSQRLEWYSTFRGRLGIAWDRFMVYGTGGLAVGNTESNTTVAFGTVAVNPVYSNAVHAGSFSDTRLGWVVGGGFEYALSPNWSVKAEYLHLDFDSIDFTSPLTAPAGVAAGYSWSTHVRNYEDVARIGVNYRFGCCHQQAPPPLK